jgi:hypothetical protein
MAWNGMAWASCRGRRNGVAPPAMVGYPSPSPGRGMIDPAMDRPAGLSLIVGVNSPAINDPNEPSLGATDSSSRLVREIGETRPSLPTVRSRIVA